MVKFVAEGPSGHTIGLGITDGNIQLLKQDMPIRVDLRELDCGLRGQIVILYGKDEETIENNLREIGLLTEQSVVRRQS